MQGRDAQGVIPDPEFVVVQIGRSNPTYYCGGFNSADILQCSGIAEDFAFSRKRLRFSAFSPWMGFMFDPPESGGMLEEGMQDIYVQIGSCSPV
jgi:hypothetical protein